MIKKIFSKVNKIAEKMNEDHTGAYAAQSAFFMVLSLIPILLLLLTMVQYTPLTKADVLTAVKEVFPKSFNTMLVEVVYQVYNQSGAIVPITAIVALWSAGRGVLAMTSGLNCVYERRETRNYLFLRIRATFYTVMFIVIIILSLAMLVFGNSISLLVDAHAPIFSGITNFMIEIRTVTAFFVLVFFSTMIYGFLPNTKARLRQQIPGAVFNSLGWLLMSFFFSVYLKIFKGFSDMYGSLTTIILVMLWLYFCMYIMLLGGELNMFLKKIMGEYFWYSEKYKEKQQGNNKERRKHLDIHNRNEYNG
ncbi:MAG: YihY/virulence factor BrkB family protein [Lachnospiraceae bacterium]